MERLREQGFFSLQDKALGRAYHCLQLPNGRVWEAELDFSWSSTEQGKRQQTQAEHSKFQLELKKTTIRAVKCLSRPPREAVKSPCGSNWLLLALSRLLDQVTAKSPFQSKLWLSNSVMLCSGFENKEGPSTTCTSRSVSVKAKSSSRRVVTSSAFSKSLT